MESKMSQQNNLYISENITNLNEVIIASLWVKFKSK